MEEGDEEWARGAVGLVCKVAHTLSARCTEIVVRRQRQGSFCTFCSLGRDGTEVASEYFLKLVTARPLGGFSNRSTRTSRHRSQCIT